MDIDKLNKANELRNKIDKYKEALNCFETFYDDNRKPTSNNPKIIIEYDDWDGRETTILPDVINDNMIIILKDYISKCLVNVEKEFESL